MFDRQRTRVLTTERTTCIAKQTQSEGEALANLVDAKPKKTHLVNRNAHLAAASKIVAIMEKVDPAKWRAVLSIVRESLQIQPELPIFKEEAVK